MFHTKGITETWHTGISADLFEIGRYKTERVCRKNRKGGGVPFYNKKANYWLGLETTRFRFSPFQ